MPLSHGLTTICSLLRAYLLITLTTCVPRYGSLNFEIGLPNNRQKKTMLLPVELLAYVLIISKTCVDCMCHVCTGIQSPEQDVLIQNPQEKVDL